MNESVKYIVSCNGIKLERSNEDRINVELESRSSNNNVVIEFGKNHSELNCIVERTRDLIEISAFIYAAEVKAIKEEHKHLINFKRNKTFHIHIKVKDFEFWNRRVIKEKLEEALSFLSGGNIYKFSFYKDETENEKGADLKNKFDEDKKERTAVTLFSTGIDSLAGAIELLENTENNILLVSHQAGRPGVIRAQRKLYKMLNDLYPGRCRINEFRCRVKEMNVFDENISTRGFLYTSAAFAVSKIYNQDCFYIFNNGINTLGTVNKRIKSDGRRDRATHPKTLMLMEELFNIISEEPFHIYQPYLLKTKSDVIEIFKRNNKPELLKESVSCTGIKNHPKEYSHCGMCQSCIDRRFAVYAAGMEKDDDEIYYFDFLSRDINNEETEYLLNGYLESVYILLNQDIDGFYFEKGNEIFEFLEYVAEGDRIENIEKLYDLHQKFAGDVRKAINRMREKFDDAFYPARKNSFFTNIINKRNYIVNNMKLYYTPEHGSEKKDIPSRGLKKLTKDICESLINAGRINSVLEETKNERQISELVIPVMERKYYVSEANRNSINDYFRKGELVLVKDKTGKVTVRDMYVRKNVGVVS